MKLGVDSLIRFCCRVVVFYGYLLYAVCSIGLFLVLCWVRLFATPPGYLFALGPRPPQRVCLISALKHICAYIVFKSSISIGLFVMLCDHYCFFPLCLVYPHRVHLVWLSAVVIAVFVA